MAPNSQEDAHNQTAARSFFLGLGLILVGGLAYWAVTRPDDDVVTDNLPNETVSPTEHTEVWELGPEGIALDPFVFDVQRLEDEWAEELESLPPLQMDSAEDELIETFFEINAQSADREVTEVQVRALNEALVVSVSQYITTHNPDAYKRLGWILVDEFNSAISSGLERIASGTTDFQSLLGDDGPTAQYFAERVGNFFDMALETGLISETGELQFDENLLTVLFRFRWFGFAEAFSTPRLMTPYERQVYWRWGIEAADGVPLSQRLAMIDQIEGVYETRIHPDFVRGVVCYKDGEWGRAEVFFLDALSADPDNSRYQVVLDRLLDEMADVEAQ